MSYRFLFLLIWIFFLTACTTDPCENRSCGEGVCNEVSGDCLCSLGYQWGADERCTVQWSETFAGSYLVKDSCQGATPGTAIYTSQLTSQDPTTVVWTNFRNSGMGLPITHTSSTALEINWQRNDTVIIGSSSVRNDELSIYYIVRDTTNQVNDTCSAVFTKQ